MVGVLRDDFSWLGRQPRLKNRQLGFHRFCPSPAMPIVVGSQLAWERSIPGPAMQLVYYRRSLDADSDAGIPYP
jgi:hypothetical protein